MDWFKFSWGDGNIWEYKNNQPFVIDLSNIEETDQTPIDVCISGINEIVKTYPPPYNLLLSGGIDSQAMLYAWIKSGVPFNVVSFRYNDFYNNHDLFMLDIVKEKFNIAVKYYDVDYFHFLHNELDNYAREYICNSPQITFYMKLSELITEGTSIFSGNPLNLTMLKGNIGLDYTILGLHRYQLKTNRAIIPFFFCHYPKMVYSFHRTYIDKTLPTAKEFELKKYDIKNLHYLNSGFDIIPTKKYSGFEQYKNFYDNIPYTNNSIEKLKYQQFTSKRNFDFLFRYRLFEINKYNTELHWIVPKKINFGRYNQLLP